MFVRDLKYKINISFEIILKKSFNLWGETMKKRKENVLSATFLIIDFIILIIVSFLFLRMESYFKTYEEKLNMYEEKLNMMSENLKQQIFKFSMNDLKSKYEKCEFFNLTLNNQTYQFISRICMENLLNQYYKKGTSDGYTLAVQQLFKQGSNCQPFPVYFNNKTMYLINYACKINQS